MHKVEKSWGKEVWLCNNELYCGKILYLDQGKYCSFHYHKRKTEDFYILFGVIILEVQKPGEPIRQLIAMGAGDSIHIDPGTKHRFIGISDNTAIIETSTQHFDDDSYRDEPSCPVDKEGE